MKRNLIRATDVALFFSLLNLIFSAKKKVLVYLPRSHDIDLEVHDGVLGWAGLNWVGRCACLFYGIHRFFVSLSFLSISRFLGHQPHINDLDGTLELIAGLRNGMACAV